MKRWGFVLLVIVMIFGALAEVAGTESKPEGGSLAAREKQETISVIWAGESGGFTIRWTAMDIQVQPLKPPNRVVFSARSLAQKEFARIAATEQKYGFKERYCEVVCNYKILSVAGSILSFFEGGDVDCEKTAHPSSTNRFTVIDLKKPGDFSRRRVKLTDYFPEAAVYQALLGDPRLREALSRREPRPPQSPRNLAELCTGLKDVLLDDGFCSYALPEDFLTRFAFHRLEGDKVAVRLALPYFGEICRGRYLELDLLLPVPENLKEPLALAQTGKAGFLMQDQKRLSGEQSTIMRFTKGKEKAEPVPE
ncbi:MAG: hypothetical protein NTY36_00190 [Deltaproteobacteria bacterium]|nr:hypothetical protein [Deltaproteobacteria bacterium]